MKAVNDYLISEMRSSEPLGGGGHSPIKVTGVCLPMHQIKGLSVTIFLQKRGSLGDRPEKEGSLGVKLHKIRAILTIFFFQIFAAICKSFQNLMISLYNTDQKTNRGLGHWV